MKLKKVYCISYRPIDSSKRMTQKFMPSERNLIFKVLNELVDEGESAEIYTETMAESEYNSTFGIQEPKYAGFYLGGGMSTNDIK